MHSMILTTATRYMLPLLLLFSVFLLLRGHNEPGGGFVGGLVAATAFALYAISSGVKEAKKTLGAAPVTLITMGLGLAAFSGVPALMSGLPYLTGLWSTIEIPAVGKLGTPLMFDIGVYLVVIGISLTIIFALAEEENI